MIISERKNKVPKALKRMASNTKQHETSIGEMRKRRETMADGKRYIIYYTFENESSSEDASEVSVALENQKAGEVSENV